MTQWHPENAPGTSPVLYEVWVEQLLLAYEARPGAVNCKSHHPLQLHLF